MVAALVLVLVAGLALKHHTEVKRNQAQGVLNSAKAHQAELQLTTETVKRQLGELQMAGGKSRLELVRALDRSRLDWRKFILQLSNAAFPGITIASFNAKNPAAAAVGTPTPGVATPPDLSLNGRASSRAALQQFVANLRQNASMVTSVDLRKVTQVGEGGSRGANDWLLDLHIRPPGPLPAAAPDPSAGVTTTPGATP
jgi:hypothetical protein